MSRGSVQIGLNKRIPSHLESFEKTHTVAEEAGGHSSPGDGVSELELKDSSVKHNENKAKDALAERTEAHKPSKPSFIPHLNKPYDANPVCAIPPL